MSTITIVVIFLVSGVAIIGIGLFAMLRNKEPHTERVKAYAGTAKEKSKQRPGSADRLNRVRFRVNSALEIISSEEIQLRLMSANWQISVIEYYLITIAGVFISFLVGWILTGVILSGVGLGVIVYFIPGIMLRQSGQRRKLKFQNQLLDVLTLISGSIRVGYSMLQSLDVVVSEMTAPAAEEFSRLRREVELGLPLSQALINLSSRMQSDDLYLIVTAININQQVGGNLTIMLDAVSDTIRERIRILGEVRVLTTYARFSSYILTLLPVLTTGVLFLINPSYMLKLFEPGFTRFILIGAISGVVVGNIWLQRISKIEV